MRGVSLPAGNRAANVETIAWQDDPAKPIAAARMNYLLCRVRTFWSRHLAKRPTRFAR
jgi:hypothetical protein